MKQQVVAVVCARGGSKGLPGKNLMKLAGTPLVAHSVATAVACRRFDRIIVSTEDQKIADAAVRAGAEAPFMRPPELARDHSPEWHVWRHAIDRLGLADNDIFVSLPPTSPLRSPDDVRRCVDLFLEGDSDMVITVRRAGRHPSFNMVTVDGHGAIHLLMPPQKAFHRRQEAPPAYDMTTVAYVTRPKFVKRTEDMFSGCIRAVKIPEIRAVDIDTRLDFAFAEFLFARYDETVRNLEDPEVVS